MNDQLPHETLEPRIRRIELECQREQIERLLANRIPDNIHGPEARALATAITAHLAACDAAGIELS